MEGGTGARREGGGGADMNPHFPSDLRIQENSRANAQKTLRGRMKSWTRREGVGGDQWLLDEEGGLRGREVW